MTTKHRNLSEVVRDYLKARPGERFYADTLAEEFGADPKTMRNCLNSLVGRQLLDRFMPSNPKQGKTAYWWLPADERKAVKQDMRVQAPVRTWKPMQPHALMHHKLAEIRAHRAQYPSGPSGAAQEMSELDRNKLAMIGSSN